MKNTTNATLKENCFTWLDIEEALNDIDFSFLDIDFTFDLEYPEFDLEEVNFEFLHEGIPQAQSYSSLP